MTHKKIRKAIPKITSKFVRDSKQALKVGKKITKRKFKLKKRKLDFQ